MKTCFKISILLIGVLFLTFCANPKKKEAQKEVQSIDKMDWWKDAKFGMFIHWGVYSVPAGTYKGHKIGRVGEWIMNRGKIPVAEYKKLAGKFNPVNYDADAWVKMAKDAGMKYIVITSKHHDGFALFDSKVTKWDMVDATPYGKDLLKPLAEACHREGIRLGFYYSQAQDWNHPGGAAAFRNTTQGWANPDSTKIDAYARANKGHWDPAQLGDMDKYIDEIAIPQVKEILTNYGDLDILWWDTPTDMTDDRSAKFAALLDDYPNIITNNRLGKQFKGDTETPEQFIPATGFPNRDWEVCMTMNDTWGYKSYDDNWKSGNDLLLKLSEITSKGGNFLLNIGPNALGEFPKPSIERLAYVGNWMKINNEAIYGTQASPFSYLPFGRATLKGQKLYLHITDWPTDGFLRVPLSNKITKAYLLTDKETDLPITQDKQSIKITVPNTAPDILITIVVLEFEGTPIVLPIPSTGKKGKASSEAEGTSVANLFDGDPHNHWSPAKGEKTAWVELDLGEEVAIANIMMAEEGHLYEDYSQPFELQVKKEGKWQTILKSRTGGSGHSESFVPVKGRYFRLNITGARGADPILKEWILNRAI